MRWREANRAADAALKLAAEATDEELNALAAEASGGLGATASLAEERLAAELADEEDGYRFDPFTILSILAAFLPMLLECFNPAEAAKRGGVRLKLRMTLAIMREDRRQ